jgi:S1-C subfamily serine protease
MRVGDWVVCIGNPLDLNQSATVGIISAHNRTGEELGLKGAGPFLQVDCSINGGNSGAPLNPSATDTADDRSVFHLSFCMLMCIQEGRS